MNYSRKINNKNSSSKKESDEYFMKSKEEKNKLIIRSNYTPKLSDQLYLVISYGISLDKKEIYKYCDKYLIPIDPSDKKDIYTQVIDSFHFIGLQAYYSNDKFYITHQYTHEHELKLKEFSNTLHPIDYKPSYQEHIKLALVGHHLHYDPKWIVGRENPNKDADIKVLNGILEGRYTVSSLGEMPHTIVFTYFKPIIQNENVEENNKYTISKKKVALKKISQMNINNDSEDEDSEDEDSE